MTGQGDSGRVVYNCHEGCRYEGGGSVGVVATLELGRAWLERSRVEAIKNQEAMREGGYENWGAHRVTEIEEINGALGFYSGHDVFVVTPMTVWAELWPE